MSSDRIAPPVVETPERRAFYERISRQNLTPLWLSLGQPGHAGTGQRLHAGRVVVRRHSCGDARSRPPDHGERGRAARARSSRIRAARAIEDHDRPLCRRPARAAWRGRARASTCAERAPLRAGRRRRAHGRRWRTDDDARRRLHHHAAAWRGTTTATRASEPIFWLDGLDIPIVQFLDASFAEHHDEDEQPVSRPVGDSERAVRLNLLPVDHKAGDRRVSGLQLPLRADARSARAQLADRRRGTRATGSRCDIRTPSPAAIR